MSENLSLSGCPVIECSRCALEKTDSPLSQYYSYRGAFEYTPPAYSAYSAYPVDEEEASVYHNLIPGPEVPRVEEKDCLTDQQQKLPELSRVYYDFLFDSSYMPAGDCESGDPINSQPGGNASLDLTKSNYHHKLGECRALEAGEEDPLGVGPELMQELKESLEGTELADADKESLYSLISIASNSKFLFDGNNMVRVRLQGSIRQRFVTNPDLFARIKKFVRQKGTY